jgi:uncharacterized protein (DUF433 family)
MIDKGIYLLLSSTHFYQGLMSGSGEHEFEYGGKGDAFLILNGEKLGLPRSRIKAAAETLANFRGGLTFLAHRDFYFDSNNLFLKLDDALISLSERGQLVDKEIIERGLKQLNYGSDGYASEFYPSVGETEQKDFVVSPTINFGRLCIARTGVGADIIALRFERGEKISEIAQDYAATTDEVEEAIRWHARLAPHDRAAA